MILGGTGARSGPLDAPITTNGIAAEFDFNGDGHNEFDYSYAASRFDDPTQEYYRVDLGLRSYGGGKHLKASATRVPFQKDEAISVNSPEFLTEGGSNWIGLGAYDAARFAEGLPWRFVDITKGLPGIFWRNRTEVIIGFRFSVDDGAHFGWFRYVRPDTNFTTAFELAAYDWNPLPGEPIGAGLPPVIPLIPEMAEDGLRLSWPAAIASWILEFTDELGPEAYWQAIPEASGTEILLPPPEVTRFYRMRKP
ncbi:MAG TPA: hypothetical protein DCE44_17130 [Verrucomicrobiales bacterium]|nr:hypothetical protein [Verrucomicrobiales bacterium]